MPLGVAVAFVGVAALLGAKFGLALTLLVLAAGALLLVISLIYRAVMVLLDAEDDGQGDAAVADITAQRTPAEESKERAVKALRDLEHEHGIGNTSDEDYQTLRARFREDAKDAMRHVDEERRERREAAERWLASQRSESPAVKLTTKSPEIKAKVSASKARGCPSCAGANDDDAKFCKHCGATISTATAGEAEAG